jgi:DNA-cytosine methyltransferase
VKQISLFAGVGAFELAGRENNVKTVLSCELDKYASQVLRKQFKSTEIFNDDVRKINGRDVISRYGHIDIITAGFPCQTFSIAGKRQGFTDATRGTLFFEVARLADEIKPEYIFLENVRGLTNHLTETTFDSIMYDLYLEIYVRCEWKNISIHNKKLSTLKKNMQSYLLGILPKELMLQREHYDGLSKITLKCHYEKVDIALKNGLKKKLRYLTDQILQIMKNGNFYQEGQEDQSQCNVKELMPHLKELNSQENILQKDMLWLDTIMDMLVDVGLKQGKKLDGMFDLTKLYTTSTEINWTIDKKTYTYVQELYICLFIVKQWALSKNFLIEMKLDLTLPKIGIYYAKTFNIIIKRLDELGYDCEWSLQNSKYFGVPQNRERVFIVGHLRGKRTKQIFPIRYNGEKSIKREQRGMEIQTAQCLNARMHKMGRDDNYIKVKSGSIVGFDGGQKFREIKSGLSPALMARAREDGSGQPVIAIQNGHSQQNGKGWNEDNFFTLDSTYGCGQGIGPEKKKSKIRRLTPIECERLQSFPDNWTKTGIDENGEKVEISDTQRYKQMGNSITVNVLREIYNKIN